MPSESVRFCGCSPVIVQAHEHSARLLLHSTRSATKFAPFRLQELRDHVLLCVDDAQDGGHMATTVNIGSIFSPPHSSDSGLVISLIACFPSTAITRMQGCLLIQLG